MVFFPIIWRDIEKKKTSENFETNCLKEFEFFFVLFLFSFHHRMLMPVDICLGRAINKEDTRMRLRTWKLVDEWRPSLNNRIIENSQNTEKSPGDLRRLAVIQTPVKNHQLTLMWKTTIIMNGKKLVTFKANNHPIYSNVTWWWSGKYK